MTLWMVTVVDSDAESLLTKVKLVIQGMGGSYPQDRHSVPSDRNLVALSYMLEVVERQQARIEELERRVAMPQAQPRYRQRQLPDAPRWCGWKVPHDWHEYDGSGSLRYTCRGEGVGTQLCMCHAGSARVHAQCSEPRQHRQHDWYLEEQRRWHHCEGRSVTVTDEPQYGRRKGEQPLHEQQSRKRCGQTGLHDEHPWEEVRYQVPRWSKMWSCDGNTSNRGVGGSE
jgi:hypothetical protein